MQGGRDEEPTDHRRPWRLDGEGLEELCGPDLRTGGLPRWIPSEDLGQEAFRCAEGALVRTSIVGDAGRRATDGVLVRETMHRTAVDDQLPIGAGLLHLFDEG